MVSLIFGWIIYFFLHSFLAADAVKHWFKAVFHLQGRYYRIAYNLLNGISLPALLYVHCVTPSKLFFKSNGTCVLLGLLISSSGLVVMLIAAKAYDLPAFFGFKQETKMPLQTKGLHQYIRHPLYSGTLLLCLGLCILFPTQLNCVVFGLLFVYLIIGIKLEERKLVALFGNEYKFYQKKVKRLIPGVL